MSIMKAPPKKSKKMTKPKVQNRRRQAKRTKKPPKFPGITPANLPKFSIENQQAFDRMQENCYKELHRPSKIQIRGWTDTLYYVCKECLEKYIKEHEEMKKLVVRHDH